MSVIQLGCLQAALLVAAAISSSAIAEIPPNAAESPTGEGRALRPQGTAGAAHDWEIPDSALSLDAVTPKITINIPTEFKIDNRSHDPSRRCAVGKAERTPSERESDGT